PKPMIKAPYLFCLFVLLAAPVLRAQSGGGDVNAAAEEAVRRQAATISLNQKLILARDAVGRHDYIAASKIYEDCYALVQKIGAGVEPQTQEVVGGLSTVLLELAHEAQRHQDYNIADERIRRVLIISPRNRVALDCKRDNDKWLAAQAG